MGFDIIPIRFLANARHVQIIVALARRIALVLVAAGEGEPVLGAEIVLHQDAPRAIEGIPVDDDFGQRTGPILAAVATNAGIGADRARRIGATPVSCAVQQQGHR